jgi:hypothetical protein
VTEDDAEVARRIEERIRVLTETHAWPWMQPGARSVGPDARGRITAYLATEWGLVPLEPDSPWHVTD